MVGARISTLAAAPFGTKKAKATLKIGTYRLLGTNRFAATRVASVTVG